MTLRLILIRHAKSSWDDPLGPDHDRPLNKRGQKAAPAIGAWLLKNGYLPQEVVSSTARRTVETWERMATTFPDGALLRRDPDLYHATPHTMLNSLQSCAASTVMMLGHNPGIADFARRLLSTAPQHSRFSDYPTASTLVSDFEGTDWASAGFGAGRLVDFITPRDLT